MPLPQPTRDASAPVPTYLYVVRSRRTAGISLGVELTPNHACNYRCVYCDVPDLVERDGAEMDLAQFEAELTEALSAVDDPEWRARAGVSADESLASLCISGRGEPTVQFDFPKVTEILARETKGRAGRYAILTNGVEIASKRSRAALAHWNGLGGEIWFKVDTATRDGQRAVHSSGVMLRSLRNALRAACETCPTWIQTTLFTLDGEPMSDVERKAYLGFLGDQKRSGLDLRGVQLISAGRESAQPEAARIGPVPEAFARDLAGEIEALGLPVERHA